MNPGTLASKASAAVAAAAPASAAPDAPLKLAHSYALPADIKGHFDHFGVIFLSRSPGPLNHGAHQ
jgi:hypothetical protein